MPPSRASENAETESRLTPPPNYTVLSLEEGSIDAGLSREEIKTAWLDLITQHSEERCLSEVGEPGGFMNGPAVLPSSAQPAISDVCIPPPAPARPAQARAKCGAPGARIQGLLNTADGRLCHFSLP